MLVNYQLLTEILKKKEESGDMTKEQVQVVRNIVAAIRPGCPPKQVRAFAVQVNMAVGEDVIKLC